MKAVRETKGPTVRQMLNMTINLRDKLKRYSSISLQADAYSLGGDRTGFWCYIETLSGARLDSWPEVLQWYKENMNE